jgi:hypothetical protein
VVSVPATHLLLAIILLASGVAGLELAAHVQDIEVSSRALSLWGIVYSLLLAMWVDADSRGRAAIYRPFEFGWLVLVAAVFYLPYYLLKTRGAMGVLWLAGFIVLPVLGVLLQFAFWMSY